MIKKNLKMKRQLLSSFYRSKKLTKTSYNSLLSMLFKNENNINEHWISKTNELDKFRLTLADKPNLKDPNKIMEFANLSIY